MLSRNEIPSSCINVFFHVNLAANILVFFNLKALSSLSQVIRAPLSLIVEFHMKLSYGDMVIIMGGPRLEEQVNIVLEGRPITVLARRLIQFGDMAAVVP